MRKRALLRRVPKRSIPIMAPNEPNMAAGINSPKGAPVLPYEARRLSHPNAMNARMQKIKMKNRNRYVIKQVIVVKLYLRVI